MLMNWNQLLCKERPRESTNPGDHRAEFERDLDRCVFSTPVKRLQDKAQVFPLDPHDAVRTRLTHSLEVSSVARGLGIAVGQWLLSAKQIEPGMERWIEAICATCGLIHDLGNPPFGHSGEDAIRYWFATRFGDEQLGGLIHGNDQLVKDFLRFEGNAQSLRLLTKLQILADFNGLNLTYGTLSASCKYVAPSHEAGKVKDHATSKPGYFASENTIVGVIRDKTGTGKARNPLTYLVEAADDIVYSVADVEDAIKKGIVQWADIRAQLTATDAQAVKTALERTDRIMKAGSDIIPAELPGDTHATAFRTAAIGVVVTSVVKEFEKRYQEILTGTYKGELIEDCDSKDLTAKLKEIGHKQVYCTSSNLKLELMGRHVICDLMDLFWEGAKAIPLNGPPKPKSFAGKAGALLSENYRRVFLHFVQSAPELPEQYHRLQLVTDYVCGMTDTFATRLHASLFNG